jgi:ribose-phosphate pyrophosphokinase
VDPHLHRTPRLGDAVPLARAVAITATSLMAAWLAGTEGEPLVIGPDEEAQQWVTRIASAGDFEHCVARKRRLGDRDVRIELPGMEFAGRKVVLVDDVASTGHTLAEAARQLAEKGAASVEVLVCHPLFANDAYEHLRSAGVSQIVSTDSIPHPSNRLRLDSILAKGLRRAWSDDLE